MQRAEKMRREATAALESARRYKRQVEMESAADSAHEELLSESSIRRPPPDDADSVRYPLARQGAFIMLASYRITHIHGLMVDGSRRARKSRLHQSTT